jgi:hypothetical protein
VLGPSGGRFVAVFNSCERNPAFTHFMVRIAADDIGRAREKAHAFGRRHALVILKVVERTCDHCVKAVKREGVITACGRPEGTGSYCNEGNGREAWEFAGPWPK